MQPTLHRYSFQQFSLYASRQRRFKWAAAVSLLMALGVLTAYVLQTFGLLE